MVINEQQYFDTILYDLSKVFNKVSMYNRNQHRFINEHNGKYYDISFSINERAAIIDMLLTVKYKLITEMHTVFSKEEIKALEEGTLKDLWNKGKEKVNAVVDKAKETYELFKVGIDFISKLIKSGIKTVKELITKLGLMITSLGDNLSEALTKLGAFKTSVPANSNIDSKFFENIPNEQRGFYSMLVEYIAYMNSSEKAKFAKLNEGVIDDIANNKAVQWVMCYKKNTKWGIWHTILVSLIGSLIISVVIPIVLTAFGVAGATISTICTAIAIVWSARGALRVLLQRYVNKKPGEKFFNFSTCLGLVLTILPVALLRIPAVLDALQSGLRAALKAIGADKLFDKIEEILGSLMQKLGGKNSTLVEHVEDVERTVKETIQSYQVKGDLTNDLYKGGSIKDYVANILNGPLKSFKGDTKSIQDWLENIRVSKFVSSLAMDHGLPDLSSDAPLTCVLDAKTFGTIARSKMTDIIEHIAKEKGIHCSLIDVCNDGLRDSTHNAAGSMYALVLDANATTENAKLANEILTQAASELGLKNVPNVTAEIANVLKDECEYTVIDHITQVTVVHHLFDNIIACFNPIFIPFFDKTKWGKYKIRLGSNTTGYPAYTVTKVEHMTLDKAIELDSSNKAMPLLKKQNESVIKQYEANYNKSIEDAKAEWNEKKDKSFLDKAKKTLSDFKEKLSSKKDNSKHEVMVIYGNVDVKKGDKKETVEKPLVLMDPNTLMCCDIAPGLSRRRNKPYFMKGLFIKLDFIPVEKNDNETKEFIHQMLNKTMNTSIKQSFDYGCGLMYIIKDKEGKYVAKEGNDVNQNLFDLGNLSINEMCNSLNDESGLTGYKLLDGYNGSLVNMTVDKKGNLIKKAKEKTNVIEKKRFSKDETGKFVEDPNGQYDYVDAKIIPFISKKGSDVYNDLKADEDIKSILFDNDEINTDIINDSTLNLKLFLYRPAKTFSKEDQYNLAKTINDYLKDKSKELKMQAYNVLKHMIEIIWRNINKVLENSRKHKKK